MVCSVLISMCLSLRGIRGSNTGYSHRATVAKIFRSTEDEVANPEGDERTDIA